MMIGHLPAGYLLAKLTHSRFRHRIDNYRAYMAWGLFGSVAPDLDMFYFYFVDHRSTVHRKYLTHFPMVWSLLITCAAMLFLHRATREKVAPYALAFSISGLLHLALDTIAGDVWWFAPFVDRPFSLITVPAIYQPWWLNFILHWSFLLEVAVVAWAAWLWMHDHPKSRLVGL